ncbi:MAG: DNA-directed RNA polymerase subunit omega [Clostridia bacterium]|jgi:DNA-directed RNA polymerase subunit omega|nr:DNA-directed RNA polymerase subunit omega [Clostridia bacterium]
MMIEPPIAELLDKSGDRYTLVMMVSKRARQVTAGSQSRLDRDKIMKDSIKDENRKSLTTAIYEVLEGKVNYVRKKEGIK